MLLICRQLLLLFLVVTLTSCVEYRFKRSNIERYLSTIPVSQRHLHLDPKLGSKSKLWVYPGDDVRLYVGGTVRDVQYVTTTVGVIYYSGWNSSFEIGIRTLLYEDQSFKDLDRDFDVDPWENSPDLIFIGGVLYF